MQEILSALRDTPIPTILVVSGILFLLLSVADQFAGKISVNPARQKLAAIIGSALIMLGVSLYILPRAITTTPEVSEKFENKPEKSSTSTMPATTAEPQSNPSLNTATPSNVGERSKQKTGAAETSVTPPLSDVRYGTLEGRVINEEGTATTMKITPYLDGQSRNSVYSNETMAGFYQFLKLEPGVYEIHVERFYPKANAYQPQRIRNVKIKRGVITTLDVKLSKGEELQQIDNPTTREQPMEAKTR
jgi:hypothetical protein